MGGAESQWMLGKKKKNDVHYLNYSTSRAVFPKWDLSFGYLCTLSQRQGIMA